MAAVRCPPTFTHIFTPSVQLSVSRILFLLREWILGLYAFLHLVFITHTPAVVLVCFSPHCSIFEHRSRVVFLLLLLLFMPLSFPFLFPCLCARLQLQPPQHHIISCTVQRRRLPHQCSNAIHSPHSHTHTKLYPRITLYSTSTSLCIVLYCTVLNRSF